MSNEHTVPAYRAVHYEYALWQPFPKILPPEWIQFAKQQQEAMIDSLQHTYILGVRYDADKVKDILWHWGLHYSVVIAGWLWNCDLKIIRDSGLERSEEVVRLIQGANKYVQYIEDDNLSALFIPPYPELDALLIAVAIYKASLQQDKIRASQEEIKRTESTLLNITKRFGMWHIKREIEDLCFQVLNPEQFAGDMAEYNGVLEQDKEQLENLCRLFTIYIEQLTQLSVYVTFAPCGVTGLRRRIQEAHTTVTTRKMRLTGLDLVTFDILVSNVSFCYQALGLFGLLGQVQDRVTDHIAQPKSNGYSYIAFGLTIDPQHPLMEHMQIKETQPISCQIQIGTPTMQAISSYGCLYPRCHYIYQQPCNEYTLDLPSSHKYMEGDEGKTLYAIKKAMLDEQLLWAEVKNDVGEQRKNPIVVYNKKDHKPVRVPRWATAQDFVYIEFPAFTEQDVEVIVNNRKAPLFRHIEIGDVIEVIIGDTPRASYASMAEPKRKLNELHASNTNILDIILDCINNKYGYPLSRRDMLDELRDIVIQYQFESLEIYIQRIYDTLKKSIEENEKNTIQWIADQIVHRVVDRSEEVKRWVPVEIIKIQQRFFPRQFCERCQPIYPAKIVGVLQEKNKKIMVHHQDCRFLNYKSVHSDSYIALDWNLLSLYRVVIRIEAQDRRGLIFDITKHLRNHQCLLRKMNAYAREGDHFAEIQLVVETHDLQEALDIQEKISKVPYVKRVIVDRCLTPSHVYTEWEKLIKASEEPVENPPPIVIVTKVLDDRDKVLRNPFDISRPATGKMFFGREEQLKIMRRELCDNEKGRAILIYGPRRSGKSSLCSAFLEQYVSPPMVSVNHSLQGEEGHNEEEILRKLASEITRAFRQQFHQQFPYWTDFDEKNPQLRFQYVLEECLQRVPKSRLILILDEFGGVLSAFQSGKLESRFFTFWRGLMAKFDQLSLVLVMPTNAYAKLRELKINNALSFACEIEVPFLDGESAQRLLVDTLLQQRIVVDIEVAIAAMKLTSGNPYFMQLLGKDLVMLLNKNSQQRYVSITDLEAVKDTILQQNASNYFDFYYSEVQNEQEMNVLKTIMEITYITEKDCASLKSLAQRMQMSGRILRPILDRMKAGLLIEEYGKNDKNLYYSYKVELARQWMAKHQDFFSQSG